jgi:hypothetical protein
MPSSCAASQIRTATLTIRVSCTNARRADANTVADVSEVKAYLARSNFHPTTVSTRAMMKFCALVAAATAFLIDPASSSTIPPDAPNQPPFSLSSLQERCDDQTGAGVVSSVEPE